jgi:hypothetical protein
MLPMNAQATDSRSTIRMAGSRRHPKQKAATKQRIATTPSPMGSALPFRIAATELVVLMTTANTKTMKPAISAKDALLFM